LGQIQYIRVLKKFKNSGGCIILCNMLVVKDWGVSPGRKVMALSTGKILEENPVPSAFHHTHTPFSRTIT
jgi:hypothetical protein